VREQARGDLAEFDPVAADLHLIVGAAEIFHVAVGQEAREIARSVKAPAVARPGGIALRRQLRAAQIAAREALAADEDLADFPCWHGLEVRVEEQDVEIGQGDADQALRAPEDVLSRDAAKGAMHCRLGDSVHVDERRLLVGKPLDPGAQDGKIERFAAEDQVPERASAGIVGERDGRELAECGRRLGQDGHALLAQQAREVVQRARLRVRDDHDAPAVQERAPHLPDGEVECIGVEHRPDVVLVEAEPALTCAEQPDDVVVGDHHALGRPGGAGGVNDVREIVRRRGHVGRRSGLLVDLGGVSVEEHGMNALWPLTAERLGRDDDRGICVREMKGEPLVGVRRIEGHVGAAGLEDAEDGDDDAGRALEADRYEGPALDAEPLQVIGEAARAFVELAVGQVAVLEDHGRSIGPRGRLCCKKLVQALGCAGVGRHGAQGGGRNHDGDRARSGGDLDRVALLRRRTDAIEARDLGNRMSFAHADGRPRARARLSRHEDLRRPRWRNAEE
jgi:hypothetical protein